MANAGLFGGIGPTAYVNNLYAPLQSQLTAQEQARLAAFSNLINSALSATRDIANSAPTPYTNAISDTNTLARTSAAQLAAANPDAQTQSMLRAIGAPQAQQQQVSQQNNTVFNGGAGLLGFAGGVIPSTQFGQDEQARQTYLASLPAIIGAQTLIGSSALGSLASKEQTALDQQKATSLEKAQTDLANYVQKNQQNRIANRFKADSLNVRLQSAADLSAYRQATLNFKNAQLKLQSAKQADALKMAVIKGERPDAGLSRIYGHVVDSSGNAILDASGKPIPVKTASSKKSSGLPPWATNSGKGQPAGGNAPVSYGPTAGGGFLRMGTAMKYGRADQGRDIQITAGAPIVAPGAGYVVRIASDPGGGGAHFGPSYPIVHFTSGPYAGQTMYIGHTVSALKAGQQFQAGDVLSLTQKSGPLNGGAPDGWAEIGFAPGGTPGAVGQRPPF